MKYINNEKGNALVITIILLMVVTVLGTAMLFSVVNEIRLNRAVEDKMIATYLAQSGIDHGLYIIENATNEMIYPYVEVMTLDDSNRTYSIFIEEAGSELIIESTGTLKDNGEIRGQVTLKARILEDGRVVME